jgi:predicted permease
MRLVIRALVCLLPPAERREIASDLEAEYGDRRSHDGHMRASLWLTMQLLRSAPRLIAHSVSRARTGFDSPANMMNPGGPAMERWLLDARYVLRRLRRRTAYTILAVTTLAIGVGGLAAITGVMRPLLVNPLPYPHAERLAQFWRPGDWRGREVTALRPIWRSAGFSAVAAYRPADVTLERDGEPARVIPGVAVTTEMFNVLGVAPALGRSFVPGEDAPTAAPVAVLAYRTWQELGGDTTLVGRTLRLDGKARTVIGVMPKGFWFPDPSIGVWTADSLAADGGVGFYTLVGRVGPGHDVQHMTTGLNRVTQLLASRFTYSPQWDITKHAVLTPLLDAMVGSMRPMLFATAGGMLVILLIACANVSALVLGQMEKRATELSLRAALGADRRRIAAQILIESLTIGVLAAAVAAGIATVGFRVLRSTLPLGAWRDRASLDWPMFAIALGIALICATAISLFPVLSLRRRDLNESLGGTRTGGVLRRDRLPASMIVGEVALAVLLTCAAGLMTRSVQRLYAVRPGLQTSGLLVIDLALPNGATNADRLRMLTDAQRAVAAIPGVVSVGTTQQLPLRGEGWTMGLRLPDAPADAPSPNFRMVSRDYLKTLGVPVVRGRGFTSADQGGDSISSIVVNEALVKTFFHDRDPVGTVMPGGFGNPERIVGVVGNVVESSLRDPFPAARYYLADQVGWIPGRQTMVVRVSRESAVVPALLESRRVISRTAPRIAIRNATTMSHVLDLAVGPARDMMKLLSLLTGLALALGAVGIYGVISQFVARRTREWSIRVALGLSPVRVVSLIVTHSLSLALIGVCAGIVSAMLGTRLLSSFLFGVGALDVVSFASAGITLLIVGVVAALVPALRAGRADPALALRAE